MLNILPFKVVNIYKWRVRHQLRLMQYEVKVNEARNHYHIKIEARQYHQLSAQYQTQTGVLVSRITCKNNLEVKIFEYIGREHYQTSFFRRLYFYFSHTQNIDVLSNSIIFLDSFLLPFYKSYILYREPWEILLWE